RRRAAPCRSGGIRPVPRSGPAGPGGTRPHRVRAACRARLRTPKAPRASGAPWPTGPQNTFVGFTRVAEKIKGDAANRDGVLRVRVEAPRRRTETREVAGTTLRILLPCLAL